MAERIWLPGWLECGAFIGWRIPSGLPHWCCVQDDMHDEDHAFVAHFEPEPSLPDEVGIPQRAEQPR